MAGFGTSATEIVMLCKFTWQTCVRLKRAPEDLHEMYDECNAFHQILSEVDRQARNPWSPFNLVFQGRAFMAGYVPQCKKTLEMLLDSLDRCERMEARDRIRFIATDFQTPLAQLRNHRNAISVQLQIGANNTLGRLLEMVSQLAADVRAGRRSTIVSGANNQTVDESPRALLEDELERLRSAKSIPRNEIERHRPVVEQYVQMLSERGGFEETTQWLGDSEIGPGDSASVLESHSGSSTFRAPEYTDASNREWPRHRGIPIEAISYNTIFNPNADSRGIPKPNTFDIWGLASVFWQMQTLCAQRLTVTFEHQDQRKIDALQKISDILVNFAPVLLLCLATSSTNRNFWTELQYRSDVVLYGKEFIRCLKKTKQLIELSTALQNDLAPEPLAPITTTRKTGLRRFFRSRSPAFLEATTEEAEDWDRQGSDLSYICQRFSRALRGGTCLNVSTMTKAEFKDGISAVNEHWREAYETARRQVSGESYSLQENEEYGQLLMLWLLAAQGLDSMQGYKQGLGLLLDQLTFDVSRIAEQAYLDLRLQKLQHMSLQSPSPSYPTPPSANLGTRSSLGTFQQLHPFGLPLSATPSSTLSPAVATAAEISAQQQPPPERGNMAITLTPPGQDILQPEDEQARAPLNESPRWPGQDVAVSQEQAGASGPPQRGTVPLENGLLNLNRNGALEAGLESREPMQAESRTDNGDAGLSGDDDGEEEETFFDVDEEIGQEGMREAQSPRLENAGGRST